jgi:hypothetical protein
MRRREYAECEKQMIQKISMEHAIFKYKMMSASTQEIYDSCKKICFYECMQEYFVYCEQINREFVETAVQRDDILETLWNIYLKYEYLRADTWKEIEDILNVYVSEWAGKQTIGA